MTIILAKIFGLYFLAIGLAILINPNRFKNIYLQSMNDENFLLIGGILALLIGAFIVSVHNTWVLEWPIILTLLGWWSLIKGFSLLIYPESIKLFSFMQNRSMRFYQILGLIYLVFSLFLIYKGWS
ncbi:MAG: hypothetical protein Q8K60_00470 [Parachlamydiaceae bacterium]|nr:hypothetical protein [Parachlamydiaceae bacterium]